MKFELRGTRMYKVKELETYSKDRRRKYKEYVRAAKAIYEHRNILEHLDEAYQRQISDEVLDNVIKS